MEHLSEEDSSQMDLDINLAELCNVSRDITKLFQRCETHNSIIFLDEAETQIESIEDRLKQITLFLRDR